MDLHRYVSHYVATTGLAAEFPNSFLGYVQKYVWERLYDKLAFSVLEYAKITASQKTDLIQQIHKKSTRMLGGIRAKGVATDKDWPLLFASVEFIYQRKNNQSESIEEKYAVHRAFRKSDTGGFDEIPMDQWYRSYFLNQSIYFNAITQKYLLLNVGDSMFHSAYLLTNYNGYGIVNYGVNWGLENCD